MIATNNSLSPHRSSSRPRHGLRESRGTGSDRPQQGVSAADPLLLLGEQAINGAGLPREGPRQRCPLALCAYRAVLTLAVLQRQGSTRGRTVSKRACSITDSVLTRRDCILCRAATFREITELLKEIIVPARDPNATLAFTMVYPDKSGTNVLLHVSALDTSLQSVALTLSVTGGKDSLNEERTRRYKDFRNCALPDWRLPGH